jgi:hypothetical protein
VCCDAKYLGGPLAVDGEQMAAGDGRAFGRFARNSFPHSILGSARPGAASVAEKHQ